MLQSLCNRWRVAATSIVGLSTMSLPLASATTPQTTIQPSLGMNYLVETGGSYDELGTIQPFAGDLAAQKTNAADGTTLSIAQNSALFQKIGTTYGGNGTSNFMLPNLSGSVPIGSGQGAGLTNRPLGAAIGVNTVTLTLANKPASLGGGGQPFANMQPSLPLDDYINLSGAYPGSGGYATPTLPPAGGDKAPIVGQILISASAITPSGYAPLDGRLLSTAAYPSLAAQLGSTYGGDGVTTFGLPDIRGRAAVGVGNAAGLPQYTAGESVGGETNTLVAANYPPPSGTSQTYSNIQPVLGLHYLIAVQGVYPSQGTGDFDANAPVIGQLSLFAGSATPTGWAACAGQILSINQFQQLFSLIGATYGGDGLNTFALPNLSGQIAVGVGGSYGWNEGESGGVDTLPGNASELTVPEPRDLTLLPLLLPPLVLAKRRIRKR